MSIFGSKRDAAGIEHAATCSAQRLFARPRPHILVSEADEAGVVVKSCGECGAFARWRRDELLADARNELAGERARLAEIEALEQAERDLSRLQAGHKAREVDVTEEQVRAKQAELEAAGQPAGAGSLAKALHTSEATIRRRLGRLQ